MSAEDVWGTVAARERGLLPEQIELERMRAALRTFAKVSMFETRPTRREYHIGWQDVDGNYGPTRADIEGALKTAREA